MNFIRRSIFPSLASAKNPHGWSFLARLLTGTVATGQPAQDENETSEASDAERTMSNCCSRLQFCQ